MTTEKKNNRGSLEAAIGMVLMAHKFGVSGDVRLIDTVLPHEVYEYEAVFKDAPTLDWSLNPNDFSSVTANRKALLFKCAIARGAFVGNECNTEFSNEENLWDCYLDEQSEECVRATKDFLKWYGKEECGAHDLAFYFGNIFDDVARKGNWKKTLHDIEDLIVVNDGTYADAASIRQIVNPSVPFGLLEYDAPHLYPTWHNALNCTAYSFR